MSSPVLFTNYDSYTACNNSKKFGVEHDLTMGSTIACLPVAGGV